MTIFRYEVPQGLWEMKALKLGLFVLPGRVLIVSSVAVIIERNAQETEGKQIQRYQTPHEGDRNNNNIFKFKVFILQSLSNNHIFKVTV